MKARAEKRFKMSTKIDAERIEVIKKRLKSELKLEDTTPQRKEEIEDHLNYIDIRLKEMQLNK